MLKTNKSRMAFILSVFSALCLFGAGCKQQADDVPALNKESPAPDAFAQSDADAKAAGEAKAAEDAKVAADAKAKAEADAKAADTKAADGAKAADAKVAEDVKSPEAVADEKAAENAKAAADAKTAPESEDASKGAVSDSATPAVAAKSASDNAPVLAAEFASQIASTELSKHFGDNHGRLVVQVNRATNRSDVSVNRSDVLKVMQDAFTNKERVISTNSLRGPAQVKRPKAIHLAFDVESKALGLIPDHKLTNAPSVIVNTVVEGSGKDAKLTVSAVDARTGKVFWSDSKALDGSAAPAASASAEPAKSDCGCCGVEEAHEHEADKKAEAGAEAGCTTCKPE